MQRKRRRQPAPSTPTAPVAESPAAAATGGAVAGTGVRYDPDELFPEAQHLSVREWETLELVVAGKTNEVIATILGNSKRTVENYISKILRKLDVDDRNEAMALYHHAVQTRLERENARLREQLLALEEQNAVLRRQLRRTS